MLQTNPPLLNIQQRAFAIRCARFQEELDSPWVSQLRMPGGEVWLAVGRTREGYLLRFSNLADFHCRARDGEVACYPAQGAPVDTLLHLYRNQVAPLLAAHQGHTVLHAGAVVLPGQTDGQPPRGVAFLGETGRGKSTLTASFCQAGSALLADDCLQVEQNAGRLIGYPSIPGLRLWPDAGARLCPKGMRPERATHYTSKLWVEADRAGMAVCRKPVEIAALYFLEESVPDAGVQISPLAGREAFIEVFKQTFRLDLSDRQRLQAEFGALSELARLPLLYRLAYPRDFQRLAWVRSAVLEHVESQTADAREAQLK